MRWEVRSDVWVGVAVDGREGVVAVEGVGGQRRGVLVVGHEGVCVAAGFSWSRWV